MKPKLESRLQGEISITSDMQMTPSLWQKVKNFLMSLLMKLSQKLSFREKEMEKSLFSCFCNGTLRMYLISFGGILELFTPISYTGLGTLSYFPRSQPSKYHTVEIHLFPFLFILFLFYVGV